MTAVDAMTDQQQPEFIVAEISKTWVRSTPAVELVSQKLEHVIAVNLQRGYVLYSFSHSQVMVGRDVQQETIVAVFRRQAP